MADPKRVKDTEEQEVEQAPTTIGVGDIFTDSKYYYMYAEWCNSNGYCIEEIEPKTVVKDEKEFVVRQFQIKQPTAPTLEELKKLKLDELLEKASQYEKTENKDMYIMSSLGFKINADPKALRNIDVLIALQVTSFRSYDNTDHNVTVNDLQTIKQEISLNALNLYNQKWQMEREIDDLTDVDDVKNYVISFYMMDFTNE